MISPKYKCPECGKEYDTEKEAEDCSKKIIAPPKYREGDVVRIGKENNGYGYEALILGFVGVKNHENIYEVDPRNGLCTYDDIKESEITKLVLSKDELVELRSKFNELRDACHEAAKRIFGKSVKIDDFSQEKWQLNEAKCGIHFYVK